MQNSDPKKKKLKKAFEDHIRYLLGVDQWSIGLATDRVTRPKAGILKAQILFSVTIVFSLEPVDDHRTKFLVCVSVSIVEGGNTRQSQG